MRKRYGGMTSPEAKQQCQVQEENGQLKKPISGISLEESMQRDVLAIKRDVKKALTPAWRPRLLDEV